ncbi:MAG: hypothetical protein FWF73_00105 [Spirochaetes bacterium]|nr:hypothetical protein [Spirochaetota bacterium]
MKKNNLNKHKFFYCYTLIAMILFLSIISCGSVSLNSNIPVDVYVGGNSFISSTNVPVAVYWKNGEMVILSKEYSGVKSIAVKGNDVYAGGHIIKFDPSIPSEYEVADITVAGYWKNGKWIGLSVLDSKKGSSVDTMFINGDDVYACGYSTNRSNNKVAGYWKNGKWVGLSANFKYDHKIYSILITDNDIYACGYIKRDGILIPVYWKNGEYVELPVLSDKKSGVAESIFVSNSDIYILGSSKDSSGEFFIDCYWKNGEIISLLSSDPKYTLEANCIFISGKDVYICGYRSNRYYTPLASQVACYWKNGEFIALTPIDNKNNSEATSIFVFGKDVYVGGFTGGYSDSIPGYWKNGEWVGFNVKGGFEPVSSIVVVPRETVK